MRELILAMRAIWANWYDGEPLQFVGEHYQHTLMTPAFTPNDTEYGAPKVILAAVGPKMTEVAGEGLAKAGKSREGFELSYSCFVVTGRNEEEFAKSKVATQERIAFYGSTPAYKGVLDSIGMGELQSELNTMSKQGRWKEMGTLITDDMINAFGVMGEPQEIAPEMLRRYGGYVDRTSASFPVSNDEQRSAIIEALRAG
jgi:alkanesulfonate monooxygenase SsuD/methylene tetrahydromethanopterin reductase-like flavin-dependent oxidoreductase (luciferase family)